MTNNKRSAYICIVFRIICHKIDISKGKKKDIRIIIFYVVFFIHKCSVQYVELCINVMFNMLNYA